MGKAISLNPDTQVKGTGAFDDIDVEITDAKFTKFGYPNKEGVLTVVDAEGNPKAVALEVTYKIEVEEGAEPRSFTDHLSAGDERRVQPSEDGESLELVNDEEERAGLTDNTNSGLFFAELRKAGVPVERLNTTKVRAALIGIRGHYRKIDPPKGGKSKQPVGVLTKFNGVSDATAASGAKASGAEALAVAFIGKVMKKTEGKPVPKVQLGQAANKFFDGKPEKVEVVKLVLDDKFLKKEVGWAYNGREVSGKTVAVAAEPELELS